ncbi:MAG: trypsin-like serine protease [Lachnospiraceae bacterium]|nr:trypsin-like serine protease [Lachnospiraceae bacterium]
MIKRILLLCVIGVTCSFIGISESEVTDDIPVIERHFVFDESNVTEDYRSSDSIDPYEFPPYDEKHPYWIRSNHGEISFIYYEVDEDKEYYIAPGFPEGFSMEEYLADSPFAKTGEDSFEPGTNNDCFVEKEAKSSRAIIGSDDRTRIYSVSTYPYSATAYIITTFSDGTIAEGSGFFVGPDVVITAGHGLYNGDHGGVATSATVYPGGIYSGFGSTVSYDITVHPLYCNCNLSSFDVGIIKLSSTFGNGYFGLSTVSDYNLSNDSVILYGYPGYPYLSGTLWYSTGTVLTVYSNQFEHNADASEGESGGPVVRHGSQFTATGIHSGTSQTYNNAAVRVTSELIQFINNNL